MCQELKYSINTKVKIKEMAYSATWFAVIAGIVAANGSFFNIATVRSTAGITTADLFVITVAISWGGAYAAQRQISRAKVTGHARMEERPPTTATA